MAFTPATVGFLFGFISAAAVSFQNRQFRQLPSVNPYLINWLRFASAAVILAVLVTISGQWQIPSSRRFWAIFFGITLPAEILFAFFYVRAFQLSAQALVGPLSSLTVVFLLPAGHLMLGEFPTRNGLAGVLAVFAGALLLGWDIADPGIRRALANIFRERGSYFIVGAALAASVTVSSTKLVYRYVSPLLFAFYIISALAVVHTPILFRRSLMSFRGKWREAGIAALAFSVNVTAHYVGLPFLLAAYFISVKRFSAVLDVLLGYFLGGEEHFTARFIGALVMTAGVILIALG